MKISEVLTKYPTDKEKGNRRNYHSYGVAYDEICKHFDRLAPLNILEIGVDQGGSLAAWHEFFPNATITGIDIEDRRLPEFKEIPNVEFVLCDINLFRCNGTFDLVIDDGSHQLPDVIAACKLFAPLLTPETGRMVIEDIPDLHQWASGIVEAIAPLGLFKMGDFDRSKLWGYLNDECLIVLAKADSPPYHVQDAVPNVTGSQLILG